MFALGLFDDRTYNEPEKAEEIVNTKAHWDAAYEAHKKSVTVLKNSDETLPFTADKLDRQKSVYRAYHKDKEIAENTYMKQAIADANELGQFNLTDNYEEADIAILFFNPNLVNILTQHQDYSNWNYVKIKI